MGSICKSTAVSVLSCTIYCPYPSRRISPWCSQLGGEGMDGSTWRKWEELRHDWRDPSNSLNAHVEVLD